MDILMVTAELSPFAGAGETGETVAALSRTLVLQGHDVTVLMPKHSGFEEQGLLVARRLTPLETLDGAEVVVFDGQLSSGVRLVLFEHGQLFDRPGVYAEAGQEYEDNAQRYGLLGRVAAGLVRQRAVQGQPVDAIHAHDWPGALAALHLCRVSQCPPIVLTVHDVSRQGSFASKELDALGIAADSELVERLKLGSRLNALKAGILSADIVTSVSPTHARDLLDESRVGPIARVFADVEPAPIGVLNGIDYAIYNPATDVALPTRYDAEDASNKGSSKTALIREFELELELERPLVAFLGEISRDGGADLVAAALPELLNNDLTLVIAGDGARGLTKTLGAAKYNTRENYAYVERNEPELKRRMAAAADFVLVPALYDTTGVNARIAQRYGAAPIVYSAGANRDVVVDCDAALTSGTGFVFSEPTTTGLVGALQRGLSAYRTPAFAKLRRRIMRLDLAWDRAARRYLQLYRRQPKTRAA